MFDRYLNAYVDRRMKYIVQEWQLATRNDVADFRRRLDTLGTEAERLDGVEKTIEAKLTSLEERVRELEAKKK